MVMLFLAQSHTLLIVAHLYYFENTNLELACINMDFKIIK